MNVLEKRNTRLIGIGLAGVLLIIVLVFSVLAADLHPRRVAAQVFMRQKMAWSQATLEGITLENFDLVSKNALQMRNMTQSNLWYALRQVNYMAHTTNYQKSIDGLYMAAVDKDVDAATEAYTKVIRNCVECHRLIRVEQRKRVVLP